jgi:hypothetical protein
VGRVAAHVPELPNSVEERRDGGLRRPGVKCLELVERLVDGGPGFLRDPGRKSDAGPPVFRDQVEHVQHEGLVGRRGRFLDLHIHILVESVRASVGRLAHA